MLSHSFNTIPSRKQPSDIEKRYFLHFDRYGALAENELDK